jgi:flagellar FliJ protein
MNHSNSIKPVAMVARQRERNAASKLGKNLSESRQQQLQLDELISYREQYVRSFQSASKSGMSSVRLREYQVFLGRLDGAIAQQQKLVSISHQHIEQSQTQWQSMRNHSDMIEKLLESKRYLEQKHRDEQEQKENDDRPQSGGRFPFSS